MRVLFAGGGTAGHINPALAIADKIKKNHPDSEFLFVGTRSGLEASLIPHSGYKIKYIKIHGFNRKLSLQNAKNMLEILPAVMKSRDIIDEFKPDIVIGTGGYVCGPVLYAAAKRKIPTFVHESNAFPGITTKILATYVDVIALGIKNAEKFIKEKDKIVYTGNPVRKSILSVSQDEARDELDIDDEPFIVLFGGSLGAEKLNMAIVDWICDHVKERKYRILLGTGKNNQYNAVMSRIKEKGIDLSKYPEIEVCEYIYDMDVCMNAADLVVSRAGACTLAELTAIGKPAILVPSPYVADNHQEHNARAVEQGGGAKVILESELSGEALEKAVSEIVNNKETLKKMKEASERLGVKNSVELIYNEIMKLI